MFMEIVISTLYAQNRLRYCTANSDSRMAAQVPRDVPKLLQVAQRLYCRSTLWSLEFFLCF